MKSRPTSISVIAWILIVVGVLSLIANLITMSNPEVKEMMTRGPIPISLQYVLIYVGLSIIIISGIGFLKGLNWARLLYVAWGVIGIIINFVSTEFSMIKIPGVLIFVIIVFFLYRPKANEFFSAKS